MRTTLVSMFTGFTSEEENDCKYARRHHATGASLTPWHDARSGGSTGSSSISAHALSTAGAFRFDDRQRSNLQGHPHCYRLETEF